MKECSKCKEEKELSEFSKDKQKTDGYCSSCKDCNGLYYIINREIIIKQKIEYNKNNIQKNKKRIKKYYNNNPWKRVYINIKSRCNNQNTTEYKDYGGRGIKCLITEEEIKKLWFECCAWRLEKPSIDRKDNNGHYKYGNCQFIELEENIGKDKRISVSQFDLEGNFIKKWKSQSEAARSLKIDTRNISACARNKSKTAYGFIWRYKR